MKKKTIPFVAVAVVGFILAFRWSRGSSVFGFESPYWDLGLIPILAALAIIAVRARVADGRRLRFMIGFEIFGLAAVAAYFVSCSRPARWSLVSALLPFQTGFMLSPDIGKRWQDLSFWKMLVDMAVLTSLPLIVALVGGMMFAVRFTTRRIVVVVAVIALVLGGLVNFVRRVRRFDDLASYHQSQIIGEAQRNVIDDDGMIIGLELSPIDVKGNPVAPRQRLLNQWHARMFQRYLRAARRPWLDVQLEPTPGE
jgi:hypothetical protein